MNVDSVSSLFNVRTSRTESIYLYLYYKFITESAAANCEIAYSQQQQQQKKKNFSSQSLKVVVE